MLRKKLEKGSLYIYDEVVSFVTEIAIAEFPDLKLSNLSLRGKIVDLLRNSSISVNPVGENVTVEVKVSAQYGINILEKVSQMQKVIIQHIESFIGFQVEAVHVSVESIFY